MRNSNTRIWNGEYLSILMLYMFRMGRGPMQTQALYMALNLCHVQIEPPPPFLGLQGTNAAARILLVLHEGLAIAP
jgi:hypothetical protein